MIKNNPDKFRAKTVSRIAVVWGRESSEVSATVSDENGDLKKRIAKLESENKKMKELETENTELKKKESKKEKKGVTSAEEIKEKLLDDLVDTLTEEFPHALTTRQQLKNFFKEVVPVVLKRYF